MLGFDSLDNYVFSVIDTETTSTGDHTVNRICEIAIIRTSRRQILEEFTSLVRPPVKISDDAIRIHKITNEEVQSAPAFSEIAKKVSEMLKDSILVCHNTAFDIPIISRELRESGIFPGIIGTESRSVDTVKLSRFTFPGFPSYSLSALIGVLNIPRSRSHRAYDDCLATVELLWKCLDKLKDIGADNLHQLLEIGRNKKLQSLLYNS